MKVYKAMDEVMCEKDDWCEKRCELMKEEQKLISVITRGVKGWSRGRDDCWERRCRSRLLTTLALHSPDTSAFLKIEFVLPFSRDDWNRLTQKVTD